MPNNPHARTLRSPLFMQRAEDGRVDGDIVWGTKAEDSLEEAGVGKAVGEGD